MKRIIQLVCVAALGVTLPLGAAAQAGETEADIYTEADSGSFGITADVGAGWCEADAGSLGLSDPITACRS